MLAVDDADLALAGPAARAACKSAQPSVVVALAVTAFVAARPSATTVPDLRGLTASEAATELEGNDLDVERHQVDDPSAKRGTVLGQDPAAGSEADGGSVVVVDVASGRTSVEPADLVGLSYDDAARALVGLGLVPARRDVERPGGDGSVVSALPVGRLPIGTAVTLSVGVEPAEPTAGMTPVGPAKPSNSHGHGKPPKPKEHERRPS